MSLPDVVSREEWLVARRALLEKEKQVTCARDALNADRRRLPMVEMTKDYSTYARGTEQVGGMHYYLDMTALGRQEDWEEPTGRSTGAPSAGQPGAGEY